MSSRASTHSPARNVAIDPAAEQSSSDEGALQNGGGSSRLPILGYRGFSARFAEFRPVSFVRSSSCPVIPRVCALKGDVAKLTVSRVAAERAERTRGGS